MTPRHKPIYYGISNCMGQGFVYCISVKQLVSLDTPLIIQLHSSHWLLEWASERIMKCVLIAKCSTTLKCYCRYPMATRDDIKIRLSLYVF